jgi:hypothetical protein
VPFGALPSATCSGQALRCAQDDNLKNKRRSFVAPLLRMTALFR